MGFLNFLAMNIVLMTRGCVMIKLKSSFFVSLLMMPFIYIAESVYPEFNVIKYWFMMNIQYLMFVFCAIVLDHIVGTYLHLFVKKDFTFYLNVKGLITKLSLTMMVAFVARGLVFIVGTDNLLAEYLTIVMRLMVFLYPAGSLLMNISLLTDGRFPPTGFMKKISKFNSDLDLSEFKKNSDSDK